MPAVADQPLEVPEPTEQRLVLYSIDWDQYEQISEALNGRHVRLTYDRGALEFMTIGPKHGWLARLIGRFVVVLAEETATTLRSCGDVTMKRADLERGIEPDECYYLTNEPAIRGRDEIDFTVDPAPDLGIEVDISASSRRRMSVYAALRVGEIWRFSREQVSISVLGEDGRHTIVTSSGLFPFVTSAVLNDFLGRRSTMDENSLVRAFREWVREELARQKAQ